MPEVNAGRKVKNLCYVEVNRESMLNAGGVHDEER